MNLVNTPYDDVFRTLLNDCSSLIIPLINEVFGEQYTGEEKIDFSPNEHFMNRQDGEEQERISDTSFKISSGTETKKYHWECQSSTDSSMLVRFFEYDTQIALDEGEIKKNVLTVTLPNSAALYLRCNSATPDEMIVEIITPGGTVSYGIPIMKSQSYSIDDIFEKKLLMLVPFHIFSYESRFKEYDGDREKIRKLQKEYRDIADRLEQLLNDGKISEYIKCTIMDMSNKVLEHIASKYENVREGVKQAMGGRVLDYEAKRIKNEGVTIGMAEGWEKGMAEGIVEGMAKGMAKGIIEMATDVGLADAEILDKLQIKMKISLPMAEEYLSEYRKKTV